MAEGVERPPEGVVQNRVEDVRPVELVPGIGTVVVLFDDRVQRNARVAVAGREQRHRMPARRQAPGEVP